MSANASKDWRSAWRIRDAWVAVVLVVLIVAGIIYLSGRRTARIMEVRMLDAVTVELSLDSCNENPELVSLKLEDGWTRVVAKVLADPRGNQECQDVLVVTLPSQDVSVLVDDRTGVEFELSRG